ncbi:MAG: ATP-dependent DNA ligase [Mesorhizobium sp.]|uniref:ATP-dependent DNA ligase n=1 Tax=Mesorhizobium sp. TaxID=1871066 RepID=UPI001212BDB2|nr:RNA ligase family protein [Mesorhizobium sp.]TIP25777.1 MAG: ATP-dependent DNA ligase [Mesorhizobium sp.]
MPKGKGRLTFVPPMLPTRVPEPPSGGDWIHEVKLDGYRSQIVINGDDVRIYTRTGIDWSSKFRDLVEAARALGLDNAIIDGETIVTNEAGLPDFAALQKAITQRQRQHDLYLVAFDLLYLNGQDLRELGVEERRDILQGLIRPGERIQFSEAMPGESDALFYLIDKAGMEGMVSKRRGSKYRSGETRQWLKTKSFVVSELELLGVQRESGKAAFALLAEPDTRRYVGSAFITLPLDIRERLWKRVQEHAGPQPRGMKKRPATQWVKPGVKLRIKHLRGDHSHIRHASLLGFSDEE